jgi:uncharacterized membrane protein YtjA (UPF0391 family)
VLSDWMLLAALFFLLLAAIASYLGFSEVAKPIAKIARVFFGFFFVVFLLILIFGLFRVSPSPPTG